MTWQGCRVIALGFDQFATSQQFERSLNGALRETGFFRERTQTRRHRFPFRARRAAVEVKINKVGGWLAIVADDVAHENVHDVIVNRNGFAKARHGKSGSDLLIRAASRSCRAKSGTQLFDSVRIKAVWRCDVSFYRRRRRTGISLRGQRNDTPGQSGYPPWRPSIAEGGLTTDVCWQYRHVKIVRHPSPRWRVRHHRARLGRSRTDCRAHRRPNGKVSTDREIRHSAREHRRDCRSQKPGSRRRA